MLYLTKNHPKLDTTCGVQDGPWCSAAVLLSLLALDPGRRVRCVLGTYGTEPYTGFTESNHAECHEKAGTYARVPTQ